MFFIEFGLTVKVQFRKLHGFYYHFIRELWHNENYDLINSIFELDGSDRI